MRFKTWQYLQRSKEDVNDGKMALVDWTATALISQWRDENFWWSLKNIKWWQKTRLELILLYVVAWKWIFLHQSFFYGFLNKGKFSKLNIWWVCLNIIIEMLNPTYHLFPTITYYSSHNSWCLGIQVFLL